MSNYLEEAKQAQEKIQVIEGGTTSVIHQFANLYREGNNEIQEDRSLSTVGKQEKLDKFKADMGKQLIETLSKEREEYVHAVVKATNSAKRALTEPLPKPHETDLILHDQKVREITLNSSFSGPRETIASLKEYADKLDDPYLADSLMSQLPAVSDRISQRSTITVEDKSSLRSVYQSLKSKADTEARRDARNIISYNEGRGFNRLYGPIEEGAIKERLGTQYSNYLNRPDTKLAQIKDAQ